MTTTLLVGLLCAFVAVTVAAGVRRAPTRVTCPRCGHETRSVLLPGVVRDAAPELRVRWCPSCAWQGLGREGAELTPGRPVAHDSGFRWGSDRFPQDFGFRFAGDPQASPPPVPAPPPAHPSGFRFGGEDDVPEAPLVPPTAPPAFRWGAPEPEMEEPQGFQWADTEEDAGPFRWKERVRGAPVFRWKG